MGCSPSVLLEHIQRDSAAGQDKKTSSLNSNKKADSNRLLQRKNSLPISPDEEPLDLNKVLELKYGHLVPPKRSPLKLLLVFASTDQSYDALYRAAEKLSFDITACSTDESALEEYQNKIHDLIIIDTRHSKGIEFDLLCRSIRNTKGSQHSVVVALVKKSAYEKDEALVANLLDAGFNRCIAESTNVTVCFNDMVQLKQSDVKPVAQYTTTQVLYTALEKCKDPVIITDDAYKLQYSNVAIEKFLGYRIEDLLGKNIQEQVLADSSQVVVLSSFIGKGTEYSGSLSLRKKSTDTHFLSHCRAVPVTCLGNKCTHYVLIFDTGTLLEPTQRGSIYSLRRGSTEQAKGSDYYRRTSLAKLNSMPLEAPITKIIGIIDQARETSSSAQVVQLLDKVEDILRTPELYSPHVKDEPRFKTDEPVVSDLITALLSKQSQPSLTVCSRRSSNDSAIYNRPSARSGVVKFSPAVRDLLDYSLSWDFDIFRLEDLTKHKPLQSLGMSLFHRFDASGVLNIDERTLFNWLTVIEANYHLDNHYHNSTHAADVMQATAGFLQKDRLKSIMEPLDEVTCLIAAAGHDVDHPGKSSAFLQNCDNPLAILYNDLTVLESHHSALTFKLTLGDDRVNIFKNLDKETYKIARHNIIDMILATEMTKHFEHLAKFVNVFCTKPTNGGQIEETVNESLDDHYRNLHRTFLSDVDDAFLLSNPENITLVKRIMIKCADVSNPTRPMSLCLEWAIRIAEEYFQQTDEEKAQGLPVVMPMFDRNTCSIPKSQIGFVDYIINDMMEAWNAFIDMPEITNNMRINYIKWKEFDEENHTTLADLEKLKRTYMATSGPILKKKSGD